MGHPQLSGTQHAFLFHREAFLLRLEARAACLFEDGYRAEAGGAPYTFLILCPKGVNAYRVHALEKTCTCPFMTKQEEEEPLLSDGGRVPCKHILGLKRLLRKTREYLLKNGQECKAYRLWAHSMAVLSMERLQSEDSSTDNPDRGNALVHAKVKGESGR